MKALKVYFLLGLLSTQLLAQEIPYPPLSPFGTMTQVIGNTTFTVEYSRPSVRGREIFGGIVPFGKVWRTGANASTKISFDKPVKIFDQEIPAGKYSILTKPDAREWMIMINKDTTLRGTGSYQSANDVIQVIAYPERTKRFFETLTMDIGMKDNHAVISISWAETTVSFTMKTTTNDNINSQIKANLLTRKSTKAEEYRDGASFLISLREDLGLALELVNISLEMEPDSEWARNTKIDLCEKLEKYQEAIDEIDSFKIYLKSKGNRLEDIKKLDEIRDRVEKLQKKQK